MKCLANSTSERYRTARDLADDLRAFQQGEPVAARPWPFHEQVLNWSRRKPAVAALMLFSGCLLLGLLSFGAWHLNQLSDLNQQLVSTVKERESQTTAARQQSQRADEQAKLAREQSELAVFESRRSRELAWIARQREYAASMTRAAELFQKGQISAMGNVIQNFLPTPASGEEELRGFVWRYLFAQSRNFRVLKGHNDTVLAASLTPDGTNCFSVGRDGTICQWDAHLGQLRQSWNVHTSASQSLARINRSVTRAAILQQFSGESVGEIVVWDLREGKELLRKPFSNLGIESLAISSDGTWAVLGGGLKGMVQASVTLVQLDSGDLNTIPIVSDSDRPNFSVGAIAISPDDRELAIGTHFANNGEVWHHRLLKATRNVPDQNSPLASRRAPDLSAWEIVKPMEIGLETDLTFSSSGNRLALTIKNPNRIEVWDWKQRTFIKSNTDEIDPSGVVSFDTTGNSLAVTMMTSGTTRSTDGQISTDATKPAGPTRPELRFWNLLNAQQKFQAVHFPALQVVNCIAFHEPSATWVIGEQGGHLSLWQPEPIAPHRDLKGHQPREAWGLEFAPNGKTLFTVGDDSRLRAWNFETGEEVASGQKHTALASCVAVSPDGQWVATGSYDDDVILWQADSLQVQAVLNGHTHDVRTVAFSPDSKTLASAGRDNVIRLWSVPDGRSIGERDSRGGTIRAIAFSTNGQIVEANADRKVVVWNPDGSMHRTRHENSEVHCLAFAPAGLKWPVDAISNVPLDKPLIKTTAAGELAAFGRKHGAFKLLHIPTAEIWLERSHPVVEIRSVAFSPDGRTIAIASDDKSVHLWHIPTGQELLTFADLPASAHQISFSPDGHYLAAALHNGMIRLWHAPSSRFSR